MKLSTRYSEFFPLIGRVRTSAARCSKRFLNVSSIARSSPGFKLTFPQKNISQKALPGHILSSDVWSCHNQIFIVAALVRSGCCDKDFLIGHRVEPAVHSRICLPNYVSSQMLRKRLVSAQNEGKLRQELSIQSRAVVEREDGVERDVPVRLPSISPLR